MSVVSPPPPTSPPPCIRLAVCSLDWTSVSPAPAGRRHCFSFCRMSALALRRTTAELWPCVCVHVCVCEGVCVCFGSYTGSSYSKDANVWHLHRCMTLCAAIHSPVSVYIDRISWTNPLSPPTPFKALYTMILDGLLPYFSCLAAGYGMMRKQTSTSTGIRWESQILFRWNQWEP